MKDEELKAIVEKLKSGDKTERAFFSIEQFGGGPEESFIKANKAGLELFAAELLDASIKRTISENKEKNIIILDQNAEWISEHSVTYIDHIYLLTEDRKPTPEIQRSIKDKIKEGGCIFIAILLLLLVIVCIFLGFSDLIKLIF